MLQSALQSTYKPPVLAAADPPILPFAWQARATRTAFIAASPGASAKLTLRPLAAGAAPGTAEGLSPDMQADASAAMPLTVLQDAHSGLRRPPWHAAACAGAAADRAKAARGWEAGCLRCSERAWWLRLGWLSACAVDCEPAALRWWLCWTRVGPASARPCT